MRIIGGKFKGRNFYMPAGIKPTQNITRKAIFDLLGNDLEGVNFLELFAGSGAVGLEALSHGAQTVTFVERDPKCVQVIQDNVRLFFPDYHPLDPGPVTVIPTDTFRAIKMLEKRKIQYDVIFVDPPYGLELAKKTLKTLVSHDIVHHDCYMVFQHDKADILPENEGSFFLIKHRKYGLSYLSIYKVQ